MADHDKLEIVKKLRAMTDYYLLRLPLPKINPNIVSGLSIISSLGFVLSLSESSLKLPFAFLIITLLLDWLDGLIAKKHSLASEKGYIVDVASDRLSEAIIFIPFFFPWFYLFTINMILTMFSFVGNRHIILPLRAIFAVYFYFAFL